MRHIFLVVAVLCLSGPTARAQEPDAKQMGALLGLVPPSS